MDSPTKASVSITIGANIGSSFRGAFGSANKQLTQLGNAIKKFDAQASTMNTFKKSRSDTVKAYQSWQKAQIEVGKLAREIRKADTPTKTLQSNFRKAKNTACLAKTEFLATRDATRQMGTALRNAGIDTKKLSAAQAKLGKNLAALRSNQASLVGVNNAKDTNMTRRASYRSQMMDATALGGALYGAIKPAVNFEFAMAKVGAITNEAADSEGFKALTQQARELGRTTQYTASQTAEAMQYLGMTGMETNQILEATPHVLNLAVATNMDLGRTADITSNILSGFNMDASRTGEVADVLAQASRSANVNVEMLGQTMKFVAPAAAAMGGTLQETAAIAGVLGDSGIQATMAGTMMRSAYLRLAAPAKAGAKALGKMREEMGISAEEMPDVAKEALLARKRLSGLGVEIFQNGKMRSMVDILKDMSGALKDASDEEKLSTVKDIFGTRATSGALAIFKSIETGRLDEVVDKVNNANGVVQEMADRLKNTTLGAFKQFGSAMESIGISVGSVLLPAFRDIALGASNVACWISIMSEKFPMATKVIGLAVAGLISFKIAAIGMGYTWTFIRGGFLTAKASVIGFRTALILMRTTLTTTSFRGIIGGVKAFGRSLWKVTFGAIPATIKGILLMGKALFTTPLGLIITGIAVGAFLIIRHWKPISKFFGKLFAPVIPVFKKVFDWVNKLWEKAQTIFKGIKKWLQESWVGKTWNWVIGGDDDEDANAKKKESEVLETANDNSPPKIGKVVKDLGNGADKASNDNTTPLPAKSGRNSGNSNKSNNSNSNNNSINGTTITINAPITIHATEGMNGKQIAEQVKIALKEAMREANARRKAVNYD